MRIECLAHDCLCRSVRLACILGEWPHVALDDPSTFQPVDLIQPQAAASASAGSDYDPSEMDESGHDQMAHLEALHTTQDLISQILSRNAAKDPLKRSHLQPGAMHKLKIHQLTDTSHTTRSGGGRK